MAKTRSMTRNQNCDRWSDLNHGVLLLVMMELRLVDFLAFSGVCKSWRSLALCNTYKFIVSRPPMSISIPTDANEKEYYCLEDFKGRKFKTIIPHSAGRTCIGVTCGYLILLGQKTKDFWFVNLMTGHELYFPSVPVEVFGKQPRSVRSVLVFSPSSICGWVFVAIRLSTSKIWFSIAGKRYWTEVPTPFSTRGLHAFKGKIYMLHYIYSSDDEVRLCEMRFYPVPKLVLLETERFPKPSFNIVSCVSFIENLYVIDLLAHYPYNIHEIDFDEMKWLSRENTAENYAFFFSNWINVDAVMQADSWAVLRLRYIGTDKYEKGKDVFDASLWYFFNDCLNVILLHE